MKTRDRCKVKAVKIALFISSSRDGILFSGGSAADNLNKFEVQMIFYHKDTTNPVVRRHQSYTREVPFPYTLEPHHNILVQGISGFDVHAKRGDFNLKVGHEYINN